jgi:hypothetical protein
MSLTKAHEMTPEATESLSLALLRTNHAAPSLVDLEVGMVRALCSIREARPKLLKSGSLSRRVIERVLEDQGELRPASAGEPLQVAEFLLALTREAGLVVEREGRLELESAAVDAYFARPSGERLQHLREAWLNGLMNDLAWADGANTGDGMRHATGVDRSGFSLGRSELRRARELVISNLAHSGWNLVADLRESVGMLPPTSIPPLAGLAVNGNSKTTVWPTEAEAVQAFCLGLVRVPLVLLGWLETASDGESSLMYQPREIAEELAGAALAASAMLVQPNFEVVVLMPEVDAPRLWQLARISTPTDSQQVAHFRIEERHVAQAANAGVSSDSIVAFLRAASKTPVPQNVEFSIREWVKRTERISIWLDAALFEAEGVEELDRILAGFGAQMAGAATVAGRHRAISDALAAPLLPALASRSPVFDYTRTLPASIDAMPDGGLRCDAERLHFRAAQLLGRVADPAGLDQWALTKSSIRRCITGGWTLERLFEGLEEHVRSKLHPMLRAKLLAWAGRGGEVWIGRPLVLGVSDARVARLLQEGGGLDGALTGALNAQTFMLSEDDAATVRSHFAELSIPIREGEGEPPDGILAGNAAQLARVIRAPLRPSPLDGAKLLALWRRDPLAAAEIAVRSGGTLNFALRVPGETGERVILAPKSLMILADRAWIEAELVRQRVPRLYDLTWLSEPEVVVPGGGA